MARKHSADKYVDTTKPAAIYMEVAELKRWIKNPRNNKKAVAKAIASIKAFGWGAPLLVREADHEIIAGDTRIQAAEALGIKRVPVRLMPLSSKKAHALAMADNKVGEFATWDKKKRDDVMLDFKDDVPLFEATGFKFDDFYPPNPVTTLGDDEIPDPPAEVIAKDGDVWQLGDHLVICGDSFLPEVRARVLKKQADLIVTDPPYAIYGSSSGIGADIADDKMVRPFFEATFGLVGTHLKEWGHAYVCCDWRSWPAIWESARRKQISVKNLIVWDKGDGGLGTMYRQCHEFVGFFAKQPAAQAMRSSGKKATQTIDNGANVMRIPRPHGEERMHNAAKPLELMKRFIQNSSEEGDLVVDFFGGSGTTLIAAEHTKRKCVVFEIDPRNVDKIITRFERRTEKKAVKL